MFLIQNNKFIHRFKKNVITIGQNPDSDLIVIGVGIAPKHVQLWLGADGQWWIKPTGDEPVYVSQTELTKPASRQIHFSDAFRISNQSFIIRDISEQSEVGGTLDEKNFKLQLGIHQRVLDTIKKTTSGLTEKQVQDRIVREIDAGLKEVKLNPDLEVHLAIKALR